MTSWRANLLIKINLGPARNPRYACPELEERVVLGVVLGVVPCPWQAKIMWINK